MPTPQPTTAPRVLGIDPGSRRLGWGIITGSSAEARVIASGTLQPPARAPLATRLGRLLEALEDLLHSHRPDVLAIEQAFVHKNPKTALVIGQARGLPIALAAARGIAVHEYQPSVVKRAVVGSGRAVKEQVRHMVQLQLGLSALPQEDEADALAVALTHLREAEVHKAPAPALAGWQVPPAGATPARDYYAAVVAAAARKGQR